MLRVHIDRKERHLVDDPNLVSAAGLGPAMGLVSSTGLGALVDEHLHLPGYFGANAGLKVSALVWFPVTQRVMSAIRAVAHFGWVYCQKTSCGMAARLRIATAGDAADEKPAYQCGGEYCPAGGAWPKMVT